MIDFIRKKLELKILLLMITVLIIGFGSYVILSIRKESKELVKEHHEKLRIYTETIMAGIRNVMLTGKSPIATAFLNDARENLKFGAVTVYDRFGKEVFLREGEGTVLHPNEPTVARVLTTHTPADSMIGCDSGLVWALYQPIKNLPQCYRCHEPKQQIRGVTLLSLSPNMLAEGSVHDTLGQMAGMVGEYVASAFRTIMLGGKGKEMDTLLKATSEIPSIRRIQVYDREGDLHFGAETSNDVPADTIMKFINAGTEQRAYRVTGNAVRIFLPLKNRDRCQVCHGTTNPMRGVMVIDLATDSLMNYRSDARHAMTGLLQATAFEGLRSIMTIGKASFVRTYIDFLKTIPITSQVRIFDTSGNERFLNPVPRSRKELATVMSTLQPMEFSERVNDEPFLVRLTPLMNQPQCFTCHGSDHKVRAVIEVSTSMKTIEASMLENTYRSLAVGFLTILLIWFTLRHFMKSVIVNPVKGIENVARRVGEGDLSAQASVTTSDEIGNLGLRINEMVVGLRERLHLQKFVSNQTVTAIRTADIEGVKLGGERKVATVFFSDIRGFTAFSESLEPEKVIAMLNVCLASQAEVVKKHGGDIDKFVGDELVAVFEGPGMADRALQAAREIMVVLKSIRETPGAADINIGIGINTGEMVMGAMGSPDRMDYTVIGDSVNLGARLCGAAHPGQILLSGNTYATLEDPKHFDLKSLPPISVKGKAAPIEIWEVD